jgi:hypothetical protein
VKPQLTPSQVARAWGGTTQGEQEEPHQLGSMFWTQVAWQRWKPGLQVLEQVPPTQEEVALARAGQTVPQAEQLFGSDWKSAGDLQSVVQRVVPGGQVQV